MSSVSSIVVPASQWPARASVPACQSCGKAFGMFNQREHCQCCGRVCCAGGCLDNRVVLPGHAGGPPVAVCDLCASAVRRVRQDAEVAIERCHILEQLLNEQTLQSEKLMGQSKALRVENEYLLKDKDKLSAQLKKMEIELEVAAARAALKDGASPSASPAASPTFATVTELAGDEAVPPEQATAFEKKKKQLDMREATLQEALKKVSADAAKLVSQRTALQERERQYKETLTKQFENVLSEARAHWEELYTHQTDDLASQFRDWLAAAPPSQSQPAAAPSPATPAPSAQSVTDADADADADAEEARRTSEAAVQAAEDKLRAQHASELADREQELQDYRQELAALNERLVDAAASALTPDMEAGLRQEMELAKHSLMAERQRWEDDRLILENTVDALKRRLQEAASAQAAHHDDTSAQVEALQARVADLERANSELADSSAQQLRQMRDQVTEVHRVTSHEVLQLETMLEHEKTKAAAERAALETAYAAERTAVQQALDEATAAAADTAGHEARAAEAAEAAEAVKALEAQCSAQAQTLESLSTTHEAERAALVHAHDAALAEADRTVHDLRAQLDAEKAAAQAQLQQHAAEAAAARAAAESARTTPPATQELFRVFLEDTRLAQRVMLTEQAQTLFTAKESLAAMASRSLKLRQDEQATVAANEQKLKRLLASAKRQSKEYETRAEEQAREALQSKRETATAKEELLQVKEKLRRVQQQQRNQTVSSGPSSALNTSAPAAGRAAREPSPASDLSEGLSSTPAAWLNAAQAWMDGRQALLLTYVEAMQRGPLTDVAGQFGAGAAMLAEEVERRREQSRRNALALERTTGTIKELQHDLRLRTERVDNREAALAVAEEALKAKRARVLVLCRSLSTVTQKLRDRQVALSQEEAEAAATAALEVEDLGGSPGTSGATTKDV